MRPLKKDITDLLSDESFLNYCRKSSPEDVNYWENYIKENPESRSMVEYAEEKFVQLFNVLAEADRDEQAARLKSRLDLMEPTPIVQMEGQEKNKSSNKRSLLIKLTIAAAVVATAVLFTIKYVNLTHQKNLKTFMAVYGERKNIQLPDGSDVTLNAGSKIEINESFGISNRDVYLEGEAFFDVKHNVKLSFIVHTPAMDVKAVGTAFNVKAYLNEKVTETSLIRGLVEVTLKQGNRTMLLYPNQKIDWQSPPAPTASNHSGSLKNGDPLNIIDSLRKKLVLTDDGDIKEIAWKENKLIFEDELLGDIAVLLERWYGVKIEFKDDAIRNYRFTGIFEKEDLTTVLDFLKEARAFNYQMEHGETLTIKLSK